jgi:tRNA G18 (ribose-2'-O)-methylase SpoU
MSPQNVGMIIRSHVAFGGNMVIFVGYDKPWDFKKGSQAFSRKLENKCKIETFNNTEAFFEWSKKYGYQNIAIEISETSKPILHFNFIENSNLIVGNERNGIDESFLAKCDSIVHIPQYGQVGCLNVAVSASVAMYEFAKLFNNGEKQIKGSQFEIE